MTCFPYPVLFFTMLQRPFIGTPPRINRDLDRLPYEFRCLRGSLPSFFLGGVVRSPGQRVHGVVA